ncbi:MAG: hypothetical protein M1609_09595, partial [Firmicutes bacterium]|nr:hypothetical protein [Bacillota bacterium]
VLFSYVITFSKPKYYIIKGVGLGLFIWLFSLGLATLFKLQSFTTIPPRTSYVLLAGAILWGLIMGFTYKKLHRNALRS